MRYIRGKIVFSSVVEALNVLEQGESGVGPGDNAPAIDQFTFQAGEEALTQGVVVAVVDQNPLRV